MYSQFMMHGQKNIIFFVLSTHTYYQKRHKSFVVKSSHTSIT